MASFEHPYLDWPHPLPIAHRGGTREHPENSLAAFEHAVSLGYRYLETDVHLSADGVLVAFHDAGLQRAVGVDAAISDLTSAEIAELRVGGSEPIPTMEQLFERFPEARFNIDAKSDDAVDRLVDLVLAHDVLDRVCLASFSLRRLRRMRGRLGRRAVTNLSRGEVAFLWVVGWLPGKSARAAQVPPRIGPFSVVSGRFLRSSHRLGIPVHVWTIDEPAEMRRLLDLGVDGIMTDDPAALREVYVERGIWVD